LREFAAVQGVVVSAVFEFFPNSAANKDCIFFGFDSQIKAVKESVNITAQKVIPT